MARHRINPRLIKIHRSYNVDEAARTLGTHKNTIRNWIKNGLPVIDKRRPALIHGRDLRAFLEARRQRVKRPCPAGHLYCVRCRTPKPPAGGLADYLPLSETSGNLRGICPDCGTLIHRTVALARLDTIGANLEITFPQAWTRIRERKHPSVNCDSIGGPQGYENAQR